MSEAMVAMNVRVDRKELDEIDRLMDEAERIGMAIRKALKESGMETEGVGKCPRWDSRSEFIRHIVGCGLEQIANAHAVTMGSWDLSLEDIQGV
jgi:hypothetical protein